MLKTIDISQIPVRRRSFVTSHHRAEEARKQAEERLELERSGELHRCDLLAESKRVQSDLRVLAIKLERVGESGSRLSAVLAPLPESSAAQLETWLSEATILRDSVNAALPGLEKAWWERERTERERMAQAKRDREEADVEYLRTTIRLARRGLYGDAFHLCFDAVRAEDLAEQGLISASEALSIRAISEYAKWFEESGYEEGETRIYLTKAERDAFDRRTYPGARTHRPDPDKRRRWRREQRIAAA